MKRTKTTDENQKTFFDLTRKLWFIDDKKIRVGENMSELLSGKSQFLDVKEVLTGDPIQTWKIVITTDDKIHILKSSREIK